MANVKVTKESKTGRNLEFELPNGRKVSRSKLVKRINNGKHPGLHIWKINNIKTPCSNPGTPTSTKLG